MTATGLGYNGDISTTASGKTCQRWDSQYPHSHTFTYMQNQENYCRNPSADSDLWCYTIDPAFRLENCNVPICGKCFISYSSGNNYTDEKILTMLFKRYVDFNLLLKNQVLTLEYYIIYVYLDTPRMLVHS